MASPRWPALLIAMVAVAPAAPEALAGPGPETLILAGCDANIPLTRLLARTFLQQRPDVRIQFTTIGSTNGVALAAAGAIHIGLVSRPLRAVEDGLGLTFLPYARTAVVIGSDPDVPDVTLAATDLLGLYRGTRRRLGAGRSVALLTREEGDSSIISLKRSLPGFAEAYDAGSNTSHWIVLYSEPAMHEALLTLPFAVGLSDLGTLIIERLPIKALPIDGIAPTLENVASGRYPYTKTLGLVWREDILPDSARAFIEFIRSDDAGEIMTLHGYLPVP